MTKTPVLTATHTVPEGPNQWHEAIRFGGVHELPLDWTVERDMSADQIAAARTDGVAARSALMDAAVMDAAVNNPVVAAVLRGRDWDMLVTTQGVGVANPQTLVATDAGVEQAEHGGGVQWQNIVATGPAAPALTGQTLAPVAPEPTPAPPVAPATSGTGGLIRVPGRRRLVASTPEPEPSVMIGARPSGQALRRRTPAVPNGATPTPPSTGAASVTQIQSADTDPPVSSVAPEGRRSAAELLGIIDEPITFS